jgi:uncharacterized repeat protein (TIGR03803 family)
MRSVVGNLCLAICWVSLMAVPSARGQSYQVLYNFTGGTTDGSYPQGTLVQSGNMLYGVAAGGGTTDAGAVFSYNLATGAENILCSFTGGSGLGVGPIGPLLLSGSTLYGVTTEGGSMNDGTLFSVNTVNGTETLLHSFTGIGSDGAQPMGPLIQVGSVIYGTTQNGGTTGSGTIFGFNANSFNGVATVHAFTGGPTDGYGTPTGNMVLSGSTLYGLSEFGGGAGDVFAYDLATNSVSALSYFNGTDGKLPASLTQSTECASVLYGMASLGGADDGGVLFELNTTTGAEDPLLSFGTDGTNAGYPTNTVLDVNGTIYSEDGDGGIQGGGIIFSYDPLSGDFTTLYNFLARTGNAPDGGLLLDGNTFYGIAQAGGAHDDGAIFSFTVPEPGTFTLFAAIAGCLVLRRRR